MDSILCKIGMGEITSDIKRMFYVHSDLRDYRDIDNAISHILQQLAEKNATSEAKQYVAGTMLCSVLYMFYRNIGARDFNIEHLYMIIERLVVTEKCDINARYQLITPCNIGVYSKIAYYVTPLHCILCSICTNKIKDISVAQYLIDAFSTNVNVPTHYLCFNIKKPILTSSFCALLCKMYDLINVFFSPSRSVVEISSIYQPYLSCLEFLLRQGVNSSIGTCESYHEHEEHSVQYLYHTVIEYLSQYIDCKSINQLFTENVTQISPSSQLLQCKIEEGEHKKAQRLDKIVEYNKQLPLSFVNHGGENEVMSSMTFLSIPLCISCTKIQHMWSFEKAIMGLNEEAVNDCNLMTDI